jgi:hypothetical protein
MALWLAPALGSTGAFSKPDPVRAANAKAETHFRAASADDPRYLRFREYRLKLVDKHAATASFFSRQFVDWAVNAQLREYTGDSQPSNPFRARFRLGSYPTWCTPLR